LGVIAIGFQNVRGLLHTQFIFVGKIADDSLSFVVLLDSCVHIFKFFQVVLGVLLFGTGSAHEFMHFEIDCHKFHGV
jgi:hypothetical protein